MFFSKETTKHHELYIQWLVDEIITGNKIINVLKIHIDILIVKIVVLLFDVIYK
jgi:hypothetical protein